MSEKQTRLIPLVKAGFYIVFFVASKQSVASGFDDSCALEMFKHADSTLTIADVRKRCQKSDQATLEQATLVEVRKEREKELVGDEFSIFLHRDNYLLPYTHNSETGVTVDDFGEAREIDSEEIKFQISLRSLLLNDLPFKGQLYAAYTNQSHWQAYNTENSRPFRETNHQPELFVDFPVNKKIRGMTLNTFRLALNHQSNGRSGVISRSWNRLYAELLMSTKYSQINLRSWWKVTDDEDNPDIQDFLGRFQVDGLRKLGKHQFHWKARHNLQADGKGAIELGWSRAIGGREDVRMYLQYFNGYGESLIDYNHSQSRIGIGIAMTDLF